VRRAAPFEYQSRAGCRQISRIVEALKGEESGRRPRLPPEREESRLIGNYAITERGVPRAGALIVGEN